MKYLTIPGLHNSGPQHWQTIWENSYPSSFTRVTQHNWELPEKEAWVARLNEYIEVLSSPTILIAHSLGCVAVAHWVEQYKSPFVKGALLVAPADIESSSRPCFQSFAPVPLNKWSIPAIMVASTNDHYCAIHRAARWAAYWQNKFVCVGNKGHINSDSQLGIWEEGLDLLNGLRESVANESYRFAS